MPPWLVHSHIIILAAILGGCSGDGSPSPGPCESEEICDGNDQDCDGAIDEGTLKTIYPDQDADGYGAGIGEKTCLVPSGYVTQGSDCNDFDPSINPDGTEVCDGLNQDCDRSTDEGTFLTFYRDQDQDGFGNSLLPLNACASPAGYSDTGNDCDDSLQSIYPGAPETCNQSDDDCDEQLDEAVKLESGWVSSICNPSDGEDISEAGFQAGLSGQGWGDSGPCVFEKPGDNNTLSSSQLVPNIALPMTIKGNIESTGYNGINYSGDVDTYSLDTTIGGALRLKLAPKNAFTEDSNIDGLDLFAYDERTQEFIGPISGSTDTLLLPVAVRSTYTLMVAGRDGPPVDYRLHIAYEGSGAPHQANFQLWFATAGEVATIRTATSADGLNYENYEQALLAPQSCGEADLISIAYPSVTPGPTEFTMVFLGTSEDGITTLFGATSFDGQNWLCLGDTSLTIPTTGLLPLAPTPIFDDGEQLLLFFIEGETCSLPSPCGGSRIAWATATESGFDYQGALLESSTAEWIDLHTNDGLYFTLTNTMGDVFSATLEDGALTLTTTPIVSLDALSPWMPTDIQGAVSLGNDDRGEYLLIQTGADFGILWKD